MPAFNRKVLADGLRGRYLRGRREWIATALRPCPVENILAPHRKACQCLFPILPHCDNFFIIVFPMYIRAIYQRIKRSWCAMQNEPVMTGSSGSWRNARNAYALRNRIGLLTFAQCSIRMYETLIDVISRAAKLSLLSGS